MRVMATMVGVRRRRVVAREAALRGRAYVEARTRRGRCAPWPTSDRHRDGCDSGADLRRRPGGGRRRRARGHHGRHRRRCRRPLGRRKPERPATTPTSIFLVLLFHLESGARREGALNLRVGDLDARRATVWLREKGDSEREQAVFPSLLALLERHAEARGRPHDAEPEPVFRTAKLDTLAPPRRWSHGPPAGRPIADDGGPALGAGPPSRRRGVRAGYAASGSVNS